MKLVDCENTCDQSRSENWCKENDHFPIRGIMRRYDLELGIKVK